MADRFEVWIKDVCVARSDHECFVTVKIEGQEVYNLEAQMDYEPMDEMKFGARPAPVGFSVKAKAKKLDGSGEFDAGSRKWRTMRNVEVSDEA